MVNISECAGCDGALTGGELVLEQTVDGITHAIRASHDHAAFALDVSEVTGADATAI